MWIIVLILIIWIICLKSEIKTLKEYKLKKDEYDKQLEEIEVNRNLISEQKKEIDEKDQKIKDKDNTLLKYKAQAKKDMELENKSLFNKNDALKLEIKKLNDELNDLKKELNFKEYGLVKTEFEFEKSETFKERLKSVKLKEKSLIDKIVYKSDTKTVKTKNLVKLMLKAFNYSCDLKTDKISIKNYESKINAVNNEFKSINRLFEGAEINESYLKLKLEELDVAYKYKMKKEEEKEALREAREKEREERQAQREMQAKQEKIDMEIDKLNIAKNKLEEKINDAKDDEIAALKAELERLKSQIEGFKDQKADLDYRLKNTGAGYVYIISNIGSFGENVYKIGVTRRLEPMDRIYELSSASVPFRFDVHAMIFSYQAYQLESELHNYFKDRRVNKVNNRKEFFNITLDEVKQVLDKHKELTFEYTEIPTADEYRETLELEKTVK